MDTSNISRFLVYSPEPPRVFTPPRLCMYSCAGGCLSILLWHVVFASILGIGLYGLSLDCVAFPSASLLLEDSLTSPCIQCWLSGHNPFVEGSLFKGRHYVFDHRRVSNAME